MGVVGLMQDNCRGLSKWLAASPNAKAEARRAAADIEERMDYITRIQQAELVCRKAIRERGLPNPSAVELVGSSYITGQITGDIDVLVLIPEAYGGVDTIGFDGWTYGGSLDEGTDVWGSWKQYFNYIGDVNMLVTFSDKYFYSWLKAADTCRFLHKRGFVLSRAERVGIHNILMDDSTADLELANLHRLDVGVLLA